MAQYFIPATPFFELFSPLRGGKPVQLREFLVAHPFFSAHMTFKCAYFVNVLSASTKHASDFGDTIVIMMLCFWTRLPFQKFSSRCYRR